MPKTTPFEKYSEQYEAWFEENRLVYEAELRAVRALVTSGGQGMEVGVGTGRFAEPLGIKDGVEPSARMREKAENEPVKPGHGEGSFVVIRGAKGQAAS